MDKTDFNPREVYGDYVIIGDLSDDQALSLIKEQVNCLIPKRSQKHIEVNYIRFPERKLIWIYKPWITYL